MADKTFTETSDAELKNKLDGVEEMTFLFLQGTELFGGVLLLTARKWVCEVDLVQWVDVSQR